MSRGLGPMQREILEAISTQPVARQEVRTRLAQTHPTGASFEAAFSRALHALCVRGDLVVCCPHGEPARLWKGDHIAYVMRPPERLSYEFNPYLGRRRVNLPEI